MTAPESLLTELTPFGLEVQARMTMPLCESIEPDTIKAWVAKHRYVVLRGFAPMSDDAFKKFGTSFGTPQEWSFGAVNELRVSADSKNYLYTNHAVPFHWDGAFAGKVPHLIIFSCETAPAASSGGETLFCDTTLLLKHATPAQSERWAKATVTYSTEKVVHYGGSFSAPMLATHPVSGEPVLRFAEPVTDLNPVTLKVDGLDAANSKILLDEMRGLLRAPEHCVAHAWRAGDVLIADNHALLHGRREFSGQQRHLRRINILHGARTP